MLQFRDGPFIRPHPAFWRIALGINLLYELSLVFLLFQDLGTARQMMKYIDSSLGVPLPEKSYAENCELTFRNIWVCPNMNELRQYEPWLFLSGLDRHFLRCPRLRMVWESPDSPWLLVLLGTWSNYLWRWATFWIIRNTQILSIAFELAEYSLQHQLANFAEVSKR